jgi:hypothetical protein
METKELKFYLGHNLTGKVNLSQQEIEWIKSPKTITSLIGNDSIVIKNSELVNCGEEEKEIKYDHICYAKRFWKWLTLTFQYDGFSEPIRIVTDKIDIRYLLEYYFVRELYFLDDKKKLLWSYVIKNLINDLSDLGVNTSLLCPDMFYDRLKFSLSIVEGDNYNIYEGEKNYLLPEYILGTIKKYKKKYVNKNIIKRLLVSDDEIYEGSCKYDLRARVFEVSYTL